MRGLVIQPGGEAVVCDVDTDLHGLQEIVGGYIEAVGLTCPMPATAYINEEGKIDGLPPNPVASSITHLMPGDFIAGPMVILGPPDNEGEDTPLPTELLDWLLGRLGLIYAPLGLGFATTNAVEGEA